MRKMKVVTTIALASMIITATSIPAFAAETASGGIEVTYTANSASSDNAAWMVRFPKKIVLTDYNADASKGVSLDFELLNKIDSSAYTGDKTVSVSVADYNAGISMEGGTGGSAVIGLADNTGTELSGGFVLATMEKKDTATENEGKGYAYLKTAADAEGTFTKAVTFTFTDN